MWVMLLHFWVPHPRAGLALLFLSDRVDHVVESARLQFMSACAHKHRFHQ